MSVFLRIACQTIGRKLAAGESFEDILQDYPKLTAVQIDEIKKELGVNENLD